MPTTPIGAESPVSVALPGIAAVYVVTPTWWISSCQRAPSYWTTTPYPLGAVVSRFLDLTSQPVQR